jgi:ribulose-5-phosphate 4-epimerase/fuculose-1-phosphate aldolase
MAELYTGVKFLYTEIRKTPPNHKKISDLKFWCSRFHDNNLAPPYPGGSSGNLSFRTNNNSNSFIITCSHTALRENMPDSDFSMVHECFPDKNEVIATGIRAPSSESIMHFMIYEAYSEIQAIFHGHSDEIMKKAAHLGFPVTKYEYEYGTNMFASDTQKYINLSSFIVLKNHGFLSVGKSMEDAGNQIIKILNHSL